MSSISTGILSNYIIDSTLGKGTFSIVKLAKDIRTNEEIAIKILEKNKIKNIRDYNRIKREINIVKKINHINIAQVFEIKEDLNKYYILMEYCEKGELFDLILSKRKLSEEESAYYFYQLVNGLEYIHKNNIIHRDLKPENLLLTKNNILKIIDFGLSNYNPEDNLLSTPCGSPCYASPEMVSGKKYNGITSDIWSIGIILYAMIYGFLPFENINNNNDLLFRKIRECKVDYPKNKCLLALDLLKKILVKDFNERITIIEIKKEKFYLKGRHIFKRKHKDINLEKVENNYNLKINNTSREKNIKKTIKKISKSELSSIINDFYDKDYSSSDKNCLNNNITYNNIKSTDKKMINKRNIPSISQEPNKRNNYYNIKYYIRSQSKNKHLPNIDNNHFSILTTNKESGRETFTYNINNKTEIDTNHHIQRETEYLPMNRSHLDKTERISNTKLKPRLNVKNEKEKLYPSSYKINYSDKFPDLNSFSMEKDIIKEPLSNIRRNKEDNDKENYSTSEIKKIISDKNKINKRFKIKEMKPLYSKNYRNKKLLHLNMISPEKTPDKKEINYNIIKKFGLIKNNIQKKNNNELSKNKENININNNLYNNGYLNKSSDIRTNDNYDNITFTHISNSKNLNINLNKTKYYNNINTKNLRAKFSEDKIKNKTSNDINNRIDTYIDKNNYINNNIAIYSGQNTKHKKYSYSNVQNNNNNYSSITNDTDNKRRRNHRRFNISNTKENEESKEKGKEELNIKTKNYSNIKKIYGYNNKQYEYQRTERNRNHHEIYTYIHKNTNDIKNKNEHTNNNFIINKYRINTNQEKEEISKINNSYDKESKYDKNIITNNKININKFNMSNLPSITIDMNILNKNNSKYLKFYDAIKNKL